MFLKEFSERIFVSGSRIRDWVREGVVLPARGTGGKGHPYEYDDANLLAGAVAARLAELHVVLKHYKPAFGELHKKLRARSSLEWSRNELEITPTSADLLEPDEGFGAPNASIRLELLPLCTSLALNEQQQSLAFGLQAVR
jgi:DNA-binding transcriptional MerR regulator